MAKIALIKTTTRQDRWDDFDEVVAHSITEWTEVSAEEEHALCAYARTFNYQVIYFPNQEKAIAETVAGYLKEIAKREKDAKAYAAKQEATKEARRKTRLIRDIAPLEKLKDMVATSEWVNTK